MNRTQMKRTGGLKRSPKRKGRRPETFRDPQIRCRVPGCPRQHRDPHHVVLEQHVRREGGDIWDPLNALSVCRDHHDRHHGAESWKIPTSCLRTENIIFAVELLGTPRALDYLRWKYDDSTQDPRISQLEFVE